MPQFPGKSFKYRCPRDVYSFPSDDDDADGDDKDNAPCTDNNDDSDDLYNINTTTTALQELEKENYRFRSMSDFYDSIPGELITFNYNLQIPLSPLDH